MRSSTSLVLVVTLFFAAVAGFFFLEHQRKFEDLEEASDSLEEVQDLTRVQTAQIEKLQKDAEQRGMELREQRELAARLKKDMEALRKERDQFEAGWRRAEAARQQAEADAAKRKAAVAALEGRLRQGLGGAASVAAEEGRVRVNVADRVLFAPGSAELLPEGREFLKRVAAEVAGGAFDVRVEGHTDDMPMGTNLVERFPTNWELSAARATAAVRFLGEFGGVPSNRLVAAGYADSRPLAPNDSDANRARNRRIAIVVTPSPSRGPAITAPGPGGPAPPGVGAEKPVIGS